MMDSIKSKVDAIREVVPNRSNHELVLVLQYYDYNVNEAIAAILEDGASVALKAWNYDKTKTSKKKVKKPNNKLSGGKRNGVSIQSGPELEKKEIPRKELLTYDNTTEVATVSEDKFEIGEESKSVNSISDTIVIQSRHSSVDETDSSGGFRETGNKGKPGIEKSAKDLGRHWHSLQRTKVIMTEEFEKSEKRLKASFSELRRMLENREAELTKELNQVKMQAMEVFSERLKQAGDLKTKTVAPEKLTDSELHDLRINIKHFIGDRKLDEELGKTTRFIRDHEQITKVIKEYGEISPVICHYVNKKKLISSTNVMATPKLTENELELSCIPRKKGNDVVLNNEVDDNFCAEMAEMHLKLTAALQLQGLTVKNENPMYNSRRGYQAH